MTDKRDKPAEGQDHGSDAQAQAQANTPADRRNPPIATRFKPGQSGNPAGRPRGATGRKKAVRDVLLEKREMRAANSAPPKQITTLELLFMVLREKALKGDRRAIKTLQDLDAKYNRNAEPPPEGIGFLVVPEGLTKQEWIERYAPKDEPPEVDESD
jgi:Family of unknown function (DUF5681)